MHKTIKPIAILNSCNCYWDWYGRNFCCFISPWTLVTDKHFLCPEILLPLGVHRIIGYFLRRRALTNALRTSADDLDAVHSIFLCRMQHCFWLPSNIKLELKTWNSFCVNFDSVLNERFSELPWPISEATWFKNVKTYARECLFNIKISRCFTKRSMFGLPRELSLLVSKYYKGKRSVSVTITQKFPVIVHFLFLLYAI